jgi:acyl transferase domain-containing protein
VDYVEAHGVGSPTLDYLEISALGEVLGEGRPSDRPLLVGSIKTNIGHAEAAGGMAGLIKAVLCLEHGQIPPSLHLNTPHPRIAWDELPLVVPGKLYDLPDRDRPAIAGISGQGSSSLNAHVVIRQGDTRPADATAAASGTPYVLVLSARTSAALDALARSYTAYLGPDGQGATLSLRDICYSAATRRQHHEQRLAVIGSSHQEMAAALGGTGGTPASGATPAVLAAAADRYSKGETVAWDEVFGEHGRFVPLPGYPWQTKRYWPGEDRDEDSGDLATWVPREHARTPFDDGSTLDAIGIDSLAKLRLIVQLSKKSGRDVDPEDFGRLRTVGALREWVHALEAHAS